MKCPYCKKEMKAGAFQINRYIAWLPENLEPGLFSWSFNVRGMKVPHKGNWESADRVPNIKAYHCPACRKFIFDGMLNE